MIPDTWYLIPDTGYLIPDTRYLIPDTGYLIPDTWYLIPAIWYLISDTCYLIPDIWYQILGHAGCFSNNFWFLIQILPCLGSRAGVILLGHRDKPPVAETNKQTQRTQHDEQNQQTKTNKTGTSTRFGSRNKLACITLEWFLNISTSIHASFLFFLFVSLEEKYYYFNRPPSFI